VTSSSSTNASTHLFWIISRGAGTTALILSSVAVCFGLAMGGKLRGGRAADRRSYHEVLSLSVMVAVAVHGLSLVADSFLHPSLIDVTVPFAFGYQRVATTLGIVAGWGLIVLGLSFYVRDRIGRARWKLIHRFTLLAWLGGLVHTLMEGTDAGQLWFLVLVTITSAPVLVLLAMRVAGSRRGAAERQTQAPTARVSRPSLAREPVSGPR
jgi:sulfoxide reductase heme-binding subunit YedZ